MKRRWHLARPRQERAARWLQRPGAHAVSKGRTQLASSASIVLAISVSAIADENSAME
jgi:hypothetical protein